MKKGETASTKLMCWGESTGTPISACHSAGDASAGQKELLGCVAEPPAWHHLHVRRLNAVPPDKFETITIC